MEDALKIASCDPFIVRNAKQAVVRGLDLTLDQGLDLERRLAQISKKVDGVMNKVVEDMEDAL